MQVAIPFWHYPSGGTLTAHGTSHNVTDGYYSGATPPNVTIYTAGSVTVWATGGTPPYNYLWTEVGGPSGIVPSEPTSATTRFKATMPASDDVWIGQFICTITDAAMDDVTWAVDDVTIERNT